MTLPENRTIRAMLPMFCEHWEESLPRRWADVLAARDLDGLYHLGHDVKGSFAQFGLDGGGVGAALERSALAGDWAEAARHTAAAQGLLAELREALAEAGLSGG
jgi:hypothetical protein